MERVEKSVFISYRRTNFAWALAVWQNLAQHGYDVFIDYDGIASGDFESAIFENIPARAHFLIILTPSALEHCGEPKDMMRREIETALKTKRNIVALMLEGFSFGTPAIANQLTGTLAPIKNYQALSVPNEYFLEAMDRLRTRFLNVPLTAVIHPPSVSAQLAATEQKAAAEAAPLVQEEELTAQQYFERGVACSEPDEEIRLNSESIRLKPDFAEAYNNRGLAHKTKGDLDAALNDLNEAIRLRPDIAVAYSNRGVIRKAKGDLDGAIDDYNEAVRLRPDSAEAYNNRGTALLAKGVLDGALNDLNEAIRLKPSYGRAYMNRGLTLKAKGDLDGALEDLNEAVKLTPDSAEVFSNRGITRKAKGDLDRALNDLNEAIRLRSEYAVAYNNRGSVLIAKGDQDGALNDYDEAIRLAADIIDTYYNRGKLFVKQNKHAVAIADFKQYLSLGGGTRDGDTEKVEQMIRDLEKLL